MYTPAPMDTTTVVLNDEILALTERIAANVHDVWAQGRISEGWTYGPVKDAQRKVTPLLVPYDQLPESEKDYDRNTALETIKMIMLMGYELKKR